MDWNFAGVRIYVEKRTGGGKQIMPILQPLSGGSIVQFFGYESDTLQISGLVVGNADLHTLLSSKQTALAYTMTSPEGVVGSLYTRDVKYNRTNSIFQTMRTDLPCESPVYAVDLDLIPSGTLLL